MRTSTHFQAVLELEGYRIYTANEHLAKEVLIHLKNAPQRPDTEGKVLIKSRLIRWEKVNALI